MSRRAQILINQLFYAIPDTSVRFEGLTLNLKQQRYGIVGDNGLGKTTLLKLIAHLIEPQQGLIQRLGSLSYCPQNYIPENTEETVAETLAISAQLQALLEIKKGNLSEKNYALIENNWDIAARSKELFSQFGLQDIELDRKFLSLSGGQQTKCLLIRSILSASDFILFDEPTNNLDLKSRKLFHNWLKNNAQQAVVIVSHDRELLNQTDQIIEITSKAVFTYGGNYDFYCMQKATQQVALEKKLAEAKHQIRKTEKSIQRCREKIEQRQKQGKTFRSKEKDKMLADFMQDRNEKTQSKNSAQASHRLNKSKEALKNLQEQIEIKETIHADLSATIVPKGKPLLEIEKINFSYPNQIKLFSDFSFTLTGPERVALAGDNGSGKTSLVNLILGKLKPCSGKIKCAVDKICYLNQNIDFLHTDESLLENYQTLNPTVNTRDAYFALASFNFRNIDAEKRVANLSGGERIRAGLALSLLANAAPQFIILDEPTNHLDIRSINAIEDILNKYQGALLVISHDAQFLENIGITREIILPQKAC